MQGITAEHGKRVAYWDNVKFFLIVTVVVGHLAGSYCSSSTAYKSVFLMIWPYHMPLFIFISGLFHKNEKIAQKCTGFVMIGLLLKIAMFVMDLVTDYDNAVFSLFSEKAAPWFMFVLAEDILCTYLLRNVDKRFVLAVSIILGCFSGYDTELGDFLCVSRFIVYYPFYLLGTMIDRQSLEHIAEKKPVKIAGLLVLAFWCVLCVMYVDKLYLLRHLFTGRNAFKDSIRPYGCFARLFCYGVTTVTGCAFMAMVPLKKLPFVTTCGQRTLQIYFWHILIWGLLEASGIWTIVFSQSAALKMVYLLFCIPIILLTSCKAFQFPTNTIQQYCSKLKF